MGDMADWVNDDTPWDGIGPDPEERALIERAEKAEAERDEAIRNMHKQAAEAEVERLREALKKHRHTEECFRYAAKTVAIHGNAHCIALCANSHEKALKEGE